jgi:phosphate/phosphite/phosphonate ABC transporter binding protein
MNSSAPQQIGKYEVLARIAQGGMAEILLARQPGFGKFSRRVVLKCILPLLAQEPRFVTMFMEEARLASRISHPNVVQIHDVGQEQGTYYIAMEYIEGPTVGSLLVGPNQSTRKLPPEVASEIIVQACAGLHAAHNLRYEDGGEPMGLVHRDVSPHNLMVTRDGVVKLVDFGIAKAHDSSVTTRTGNIKGKYAYMSPEQVRGRALDRRSDIFALGTVLFEMLTGVRVFHRNAELAVLVAIIEEPIPAVVDFEPSIPPALSQVISRAMEREVDDRFATAADLAAAIRGALAAVGISSSPETLAAYVEDECEALRRQPTTSSRPPTSSGGTPVSVEVVPAISPVPEELGNDGESSSAASPSATFSSGDPSAPDPFGTETTVPSATTLAASASDPVPPLLESSEDGLSEGELVMDGGATDVSPFDPDSTAQGMEQARTFPMLSVSSGRHLSTSPSGTRAAEPGGQGAQGWVEVVHEEALPGFEAEDLDTDVIHTDSVPPHEQHVVEYRDVLGELTSPSRAEPKAASVDRSNSLTVKSPTPSRPSSVSGKTRVSTGESSVHLAAVKSQRRTVLGGVAVALLVVVAVAAYALQVRSSRPPGPPLVFAHAPAYSLQTTLDTYRPLTEQLEGQLKRRVEIYLAHSYSELMEQLLSGEVHFANLPPLLYVLAHHRNPQVKALALPRIDGSQMGQSYIVARDDSDIRSARQLEGSRFCYPDRFSTSGYLLPRELLRSKGMDPESVFVEVHISGGHAAVLRDVAGERCDAGAISSQAWMNARKFGVKVSRIRLVTVAGDSLLPVVCASPKLSPAQTANLRRALLDYRPGQQGAPDGVEPVFEIDGFVPVAAGQFEPIEELARQENLLGDN